MTGTIARKHGKTRAAAEEAIRICKNRGVLVDYLNSREKEVIDIMIMLFDQEYAVKQYGKAQKEEGRDEERKSHIMIMLDRGKEPEEISDFCMYDLDEVKDVQKKWLASRKRKQETTVGAFPGSV